MQTGINVESTKPETITEIRNSIVTILGTNPDQKTIQIALKCFVESVRSLPPVNISNNIIHETRKRDECCE